MAFEIIWCECFLFIFFISLSSSGVWGHFKIYQPDYRKSRNLEMSSQHENTTVHFHSTADFLALRFTPLDVLFISDLVTTFTEFTAESAISKILDLSPQDERILKAIASSRLLGGDSSFETTLVAEEGPEAGKVRRISFSVLPAKFSRHNAPSRCHAVTDAVKSHKANDNFAIVLLPSRREFAFAQACAAVRPFSLYSKKGHQPKSRRVDVVINYPVVEADLDRKRIESISNVAAGIRLCQRLVDAPPNVLHSDRYVEECYDVARAIGCQIRVIQGRDLEEQGFGGIWGVGKASEHLPALVIMSHVPADCPEDTKSICLVGKGIIYDTGGLSIKDRTGMPGMKMDMGGSASVLGKYIAIFRFQ